MNSIWSFLNYQYHLCTCCRMKILLILFLLMPSTYARRYSLQDLAEWQDFKTAYGKAYSDADDPMRMEIYFRNKDYVYNYNILNIKGITAQTLRLNHYGEMYPPEYRAIVNSFNQSLIPEVRSNEIFKTPNSIHLPDSIDWREKGAVSEIKDQGQCGACWAFSAIGAIEGQYFMKTGKLVTLSEQNIIDCSKDYGNSGCKSGTMNGAFKYINKNGGINPETTYPYEAQESDSCKFQTKDAIKIKGYVDIPEGDENALKAAVAFVGPISAAMDARQLSFQFYASGIYHEPNCKVNRLNRGVLIVGYGTENDQDYWLVKNSCSTIWGQDGYMKVARNKHNHCGIASAASYPKL
uniref:Putative cathepsin l n=1 Tax=Panstrongylus lignarius TaxID=156445 RepID=A0A224XJ52_9HEMI